jgi:4-oxalocrotonate tautomerase
MVKQRSAAADDSSRRKGMPYVSIRVAGKLTRTQKQNIARGVTEVIAREANKPESSILIFIDEEERENIASGGKLLDEK